MLENLREKSEQASFMIRYFEDTSHHGVFSGHWLGSTILGSTVKSLVKWMTGRALETDTFQKGIKLYLGYKNH